MEYLKRKNAKVLIIVLAVFILCFVAITQSDFLLFELPKKADRIMLYHFGIQPVDVTFMPYRHKLLDMYDELNLFKFSESGLYSGLPVYAFDLSKKDIEFFDAAAEEFISNGYKTEMTLTWRDVKLNYNGTSFDVKMKLRGHGTGNYLDKRSFSVKTKDNNYINGVKELHFIPPDEAGFVSHLFSDLLARELGLKPLRGEFACVTINGRYKGIYLVTEPANLDYFERNEQPERIPIVVANELMWKDSFKKLDIGLFSSASVHDAPYNYEISMKDVDSPFAQEALYRYEQLMQAVEKNDHRLLETVLDVDEAAAYEAFRTLRADIHDSGGDNIRLSYSLTTGKIGFVPRIENGIFPLSQKYDGSFEFSLHEKGTSFINDAVVRDDNIRNIRNKKLYELLTRSDELIKEYDEINKKYGRLIINDISALSSRETKWEIDSSTRNFLNNLNIIRGQLEYSRAYIHLFKKGNTIDIEVIPESNSALEFEEFILDIKQNLTEGDEILIDIIREDNKNETFRVTYENNVDLSRYLNENLLQFGLDSDLRVVRKSFFYHITLLTEEKIDINGVKVRMRNTISNKDLADEDIRTGIASGDSFSEGAKTRPIEEFVEENADTGVIYEDDFVYFGPGAHAISKTMIVPSGTQVIVEKGAEILLAPSVSFLSFSPVFIQGTPEQPVIVAAQDAEKPFGTFAVVGDGNCKMNINNLDISGGSEAIVEGIYFSGGLATYYCDVIIEDSNIHDNHADDGANFKHGDVIIDSVNLYHNFADQIDLDFCNAEVLNSRFEDNGADDNGDGLDLSGSLAIVHNNKFHGFRDKSVSIGEDTEIVLFENEISDSRLGAAVKDLSQALFINNTIKNTECGISAYQKKPIFGGGFVYVSGNQIINNKVEYEVDGLSKIYKIYNLSKIYPDDTSILQFRALKSAIEKINTNGSFITTVEAKQTGPFAEYPKIYRYAGKRELTPFQLKKTLLSSGLSQESFVINSSGTFSSKEVFYDTINKRLLNGGSAYYLQTLFDNEGEEIKRELHYFLPSEEKPAFFYDVSEEISLLKSSQEVTKYAVSPKKNKIMPVMIETMGLNEKLTLAHIADSEIYEINIYIKSDEIFQIAKITQKKTSDNEIDLEMQVFPYTPMTEKYNFIIDYIKKDISTRLDFTIVGITEYQTISRGTNSN